MDTVSDRLHFIYLMQQNKSVNSSSQWYQRMKSLQGTLDRPEQRGHMEARKEGKEREREKINLVQLKAKGMHIPINVYKRRLENKAL